MTTFHALNLQGSADAVLWGERASANEREEGKGGSGGPTASRFDRLFLVQRRLRPVWVMYTCVYMQYMLGGSGPVLLWVSCWLLGCD